MTREVYRALGLAGVELRGLDAARDEFIGEPADWERAERR